MLGTQFSPWPSFTKEESDAVERVLLSNKVNYWTGQEGREFEKEFSSFVGSNFAIAVANGTLALELSLHALNIGTGDEVVVTSRTYLASVSSIVLAGGTPVFADVDVNSQNITAKSVKAVLTPRTKAIICVHLAGWPCEMDPIMKLADENGLYVVEDCAQSHGACYKGRSVGSIGHIGAWSFCQDKIMTTGGEGGMVTTSDEGLWKKMWAYKDHGKSYDKVYNTKHDPGFCWLHDSFGTNGRLTEMQSAIGRIQIKRMPEWTLKRQGNAAQLNEAFSRIPSLRVPQVRGHVVHASYKCYVFVCPDKLKKGWSRDRIMVEVVRRGVPCYTGSCSEVYLEKAFDDTSWKPKERLPVAKELGETSLLFLIHPTLTESEISKTCEVVKQVMGQASL